MTTFRSIETGDYAKVSPPSSLGRPPKLEWLPIRSLVIDPEYQREITFVGRRNVRRIVEQFNWSMFVPVIAASIGSNQYAIVDGQHRVTAAALAGIDKVPCAIIEALRGEQAAAFRAINGNVTRLHNIQIFHAAVAAGDVEARAVVEICKRAGIKIARSLGHLRDRETYSVATLTKCMQRFGEAITVLALRAIVASGDGRPEELNRAIIWCVAEVLHDHAEWRKSEPALFRAFEDLTLEDMWRAAKVASAQVKGSSTTDQLEGALVHALSAALDRKKIAGAAP